MKNPFLRYNRSLGIECGSCSVEDRLDEIRRSVDRAWLQQVIMFPFMQKTVVKAAGVRIRQLDNGKKEFHQAVVRTPISRFARGR